MAITYGNDSGNYDASDLHLAAILNQVIHNNIVDTTDLRMTARFYGNIAGRGSAVLNVPGITWSDAMAAANSDETTAVGVTDPTTSVSPITVARQSLVRSVSDLYNLTGGAGGAQIADFAAQMAGAASLRATDMLCTQFSSITANVGTSTVDLTTDDIYEAQYTLIAARVPEPYVCVLAPVQMTDLMTSLRGESGAQMHNAQTLAMLAGGAMRAKEWNGITFIDSDSVPTSGGNRIGCMYNLEAFGFAEMVPDAMIQGAAPGSFASVVPQGSSVYVAFERKEREGLTDIVGNYFVGFGIIENARAVKITTDA